MAQTSQNPTGNPPHSTPAPQASDSIAEGHALFPGLARKSVETLYREAPIRKLVADQSLFTQNSEAGSLYIVLKGRLILYRKVGDKRVGAGSAETGDWLLPQDYAWQGRRTAHCVALESATVMALSEEALSALDPLVAAGIYKIMYTKAMARAFQQQSVTQQLEKQNFQLRQALLVSRERCNQELLETEIVQPGIAGIPGWPAAVNTLTCRVLAENLSAGEIVDRVRNDTELDAMVLRAVNSPLYGFKQQISDLDHVVLLLGSNEIYPLLMSQGLREVIPDTSDFRSLYTESLIVSHLAITIAQRAAVAQPMESALIGLLSNIGRIVLALLRKQNPKLGLLTDPMDHAQMGSALLRSWNLPDPIWRSIDYLDHPRFAPPTKVPGEIAAQVSVVTLARHCYRRMLRSDISSPLPIYFREYAEVLHWGRMSLTAMIDGEIIPGLRQRRKQLPIPANELIEHYLKQRQTA